MQPLSVERLARSGSAFGHASAQIVPHSHTITTRPATERAISAAPIRAASSDQDEGLLDRNNTIVADLAPAGATPTLDAQPRRFADFATLGEALDYAAQGRRGMNFHDARGQLTRAYPFAELREDALAHAQRFVAMGLKPGDRVALIAETGAEFAACFFGAVYAGLWPVPLAASDQLRRTRSLCRTAPRDAEQQRSVAVSLPARASVLCRSGRRRPRRSRPRLGQPR